jgi:hypothetical protein
MASDEPTDSDALVCGGGLRGRSRPRSGRVADVYAADDHAQRRLHLHALTDNTVFEATLITTARSRQPGNTYTKGGPAGRVVRALDQYPDANSMTVEIAYTRGSRPMTRFNNNRCSR